MLLTSRATLVAVCLLFAAAARSTAQPPACAQNSVQFSATGVSQSFVVPSGVTVLSAVVVGAGGGGDDVGRLGGPGAVIVGDIPVTPGQALTVIVGSKGGDGVQKAGGGGGASVVAATVGFVPAIVAAGGGGTGAFAQDNGTTIDASTTTTAKNGNGTGAGAGGVGTLGGGGGPPAAQNGSGGAGGAGLTGDGSDVLVGAVEGGERLDGSAAGGIGGTGGGGFGGGGGAGSVGGGGGGGYAGGGGGGAESNGAGGGGASFVSPATTLLTPIGLQGTPANGSVVLCFASPAPTVPALSRSGLALFGLLLAAAALWIGRRRLQA